MHLLDELKRANSLETDYQAAKLMGVTTSYTSQWRRGKPMSDTSALRAAELAGLDPGYVLAAIAAERARRSQLPEVGKVWRGLANERAARRAR